MVVFPLGLKAKSRNFPFMTIAILVFTVIYSVIHMSDIDEQHVAIVNSPEAAELVPARNALLLAKCEITNLKPEECEFLKNLLNASEPQQPIQFMSATHSKLMDHFGPDAGTKVAEIEKIVFQDSFWLKAKDQLLEVPEFDRFRHAHKMTESKRLEWQQAHNTLSRSNLSPRTLFEASVTHAGWLHLVGNMVFFVCLAIAVEERIGALAFLIIYGLSGAFGDFAELQTTKDAWTPLLGASSNISGIAGLFLVLFWHQEMQIWVSAFFIANRVVSVPTKLFIPIFVVANDLFGWLAAGSEVAHLAHMGGTAFGALAGLVWIKLKPLSAEAIFPFEDELLAQARNTQDVSSRLPILAELLWHHPENREALDLSLSTIFSRNVPPWENFDDKTRRFLKRNFNSIFTDRLLRETPEDFVTFIGVIPSDWPLENLIKTVEISKLQAAISAAESVNKIAIASRLLKLLCTMTNGQLREQLLDYLHRLSQLKQFHPQIENDSDAA